MVTVTNHNQSRRILIYSVGYSKLSMARTTLIVKDKNFRITIPEEIRIAEGIKQGDIIEIDVRRIEKPKRDS